MNKTCTAILKLSIHPKCIQFTRTNNMIKFFPLGAIKTRIHKRADKIISKCKQNPKIFPSYALIAFFGMQIDSRRKVGMAVAVTHSPTHQTITLRLWIFEHVLYFSFLQWKCIYFCLKYLLIAIGAFNAKNFSLEIWI